MTHVNRSRRKANTINRRVIAERQKVLSLAKQRERAEANRAAKLRAYPVPPNYRASHNAVCPDQPWCYATAEV